MKLVWRYLGGKHWFFLVKNAETDKPGSPAQRDMDFGSFKKSDISSGGSFCSSWWGRSLGARDHLPFQIGFDELDGFAQPRVQAAGLFQVTQAAGFLGFDLDVENRRPRPAVTHISLKMTTKKGCRSLSQCGFPYLRVVRALETCRRYKRVRKCGRSATLNSKSGVFNNKNDGGSVIMWRTLGLGDKERLIKWKKNSGRFGAVI